MIRAMISNDLRTDYNNLMEIWLSIDDNYTVDKYSGQIASIEEK